MTDLCGRVVVGFMNCMILARLTFSKAVSSGSMAEAFLLREGGAVGTDTLKMLFTARVSCGLGSRHRGGAVDNYARSDNETGGEDLHTRIRASTSKACWSVQTPPHFWLMRQISAYSVSPFGSNNTRCGVKTSGWSSGR